MARARLGFLAFVLLLILSQGADAASPYPVSVAQFEEYKRVLDDPRPYLKDTNNFRVWIPDEAWNAITYDKDTMMKTWADVVGFKAPDVVGKIASEVKPGKYSCKDKERLPFKDLMPPFWYEKFNPPGEGGPNHVGNFTEIEVIPTRQFYWSLPIAEATRKNIGKVKQDGEGYIVAETYTSGFPFPRPSGNHAGLQVAYNHQRGYVNGEDAYYIENSVGVNGNWKIDHEGSAISHYLRLGGRCWIPPYGYLDPQAEKNREQKLWMYTLQAPRDFYGNVYRIITYNDPSKESLLLAYVNILRRIRKLSSSDKQDQAVGQDIAFDDADGFTQSMSPDIYPYEYKVIDDREFLIPAYSTDGAEWVDSTNHFELKNLRFERRPMLVVELKQKDPNYIYSKRVFYFDKETLSIPLFQYYDQKGRLYRAQAFIHGFVEPMGYLFWNIQAMWDFIDVHSTFVFGLAYPALWMSRDQLDLKSVARKK